MTSAERIFVDTNILTRATFDVIPLHGEARLVLDQLWNEGAELFISHQVIREYIANATRPQSYSPALPASAVLEQVANFRNVFQVLPDSPAVLSALLDLVDNVAVGGKQIHDANIVATMLANNIGTLLTHNVKDFQRFQNYILVMPLEDRDV